MGTLAVVFDTNVLVSALGFGGTPFDALLRAVAAEDIELIASEGPLDELDRVMRYDRLPFTDADRERYLAILSREAEFVVPETSVDVIDRDPDDNAFLECAIAGDAEYLVSGDDHLQDLGSFRETDVVSPAEFVEQLR